MNSFWMPKKQPLYAPMLATFGGGSARGFNPGGGGGGHDLLNHGFTEVSAGVFRRTTGGTASIDLGGINCTVHVIGSGGWSGRDGMGYGNCGGGGGGGGAVASFTNVGAVNIQVGSAVDPVNGTYDSGVDGAWNAADTFSNASPGSSQVTWFMTSAILYGSGGNPGSYRAQSGGGTNQDSGTGGGYGGSVAGMVGSSGGEGGGSIWNADGNPTGSYYGAASPGSSTYGGGGGGQGNNTYGGYGGSGALGGTGGRGGLPKGNNFTALWRQNEAGDLGSGNGGQAKFMSDNDVAPFTILPSSAGVIQITIT